MKRKVICKIASVHKLLARLDTASKRSGASKLTALEIEAEITAYRKEKRQSRSTSKARKQ